MKTDVMKMTCSTFYQNNYKKLLEDLEAALNRKPMYPTLRVLIERDIETVKELITHE